MTYLSLFIAALAFVPPRTLVDEVLPAIDWQDAFQACASGPGIPHPAAAVHLEGSVVGGVPVARVAWQCGCGWFDFDHDGDVDSVDWGYMQRGGQ